MSDPKSPALHSTLVKLCPASSPPPALVGPELYLHASSHAPKWIKLQHASEGSWPWQDCPRK